MSLPDRIPVYLLSGFLGSGKSTLLNQFLSDPEFYDTAVIINEFGDVPVDHLLVRQGETTISRISTGCLCCSGASDIRTTLLDLYYAATTDPSVSFSRVIVEMSGLGDPAPLVNAFSSKPDDALSRNHPSASNAFYLAGFISLFDVISGLSSIEHHFEALKQIAFADRIVLTKTDLKNDGALEIRQLSNELREINAHADIVERQDLNLSVLFSPRPYSIVERGEDVAGWLALEAALSMETGHASRSNVKKNNSRHGKGIQTFSIIGEMPLAEKQVQKFISVLQNSAGQRLLRVKGIIATEESPEYPLIVHAVQHVLSDPVRLDHWPDEDHRSRIVFITNGIDPKPVRDLFTAIVSAEPFSLIRWLRKMSGPITTHFVERFSLRNKTTRRSL